MQTIERTPASCQYNITALSESVESVEMTDATDMDKLPKHAKWSARNLRGNVAFPSPPPIGTRVRVLINKLGTGIVQGYFIEHGWVGVHIMPDPGQRPDWHVKQNGLNKNYYLVFGNEIEGV